MNSISPILNIMIKACEKASKIIIRDFGEIENLQVSKKGPRDFVTKTDNKVEKILNSSSLVWDRNSDDVYTKENVTIKTNDEVIYGSGFKSDSKFEKYHINDVKGNFSFNVED